MNRYRFRRSQLLLLFLFLPLHSLAAIQNSFYSESTYYERYDLITESRLKSLYGLYESSVLTAGAFLGVSLQYQSNGAAERYYDDAVTPQLGVQLSFFKKVILQLQTGVRQLIPPPSDSPDETRAQWDPRVILSVGDFLNYAPTQNVFTEYYGEVSYVPRIDPTPVSTFSVKQGWRFTPYKNIYADPYGEVFLRKSNNADLGPSITEWRTGGRLTWATAAWTIAGLAYHNFNKKAESGTLEGLLILGGQF